ncbi:hypothetical protein L2E82_27371 [Cichorium intybus]|uniref:Uncharacterized protein n=1 Tax=Cichorium intybus TaxID=13427 RepID=A0ACB9CSX3_CICIN|nr:hypothetical protein L2E82_27371 [Cichorium intybus]
MIMMRTNQVSATEIEAYAQQLKFSPVFCFFFLKFVFVAWELEKNLHRVPLGINNVVEIIGPSPSAKTEILLRVAVTSILPKNWNGIQYGGLEHSVLFLDLDRRLDIFRLPQYTHSTWNYSQIA